MRTNWLSALPLAFLLACAPADEELIDDQDTNGDEISLLDLYKNGDRLDLGDLMSLVSGFATDKLNDSLSGMPYASIRLKPTEVYTSADRASGDLTLKDLDALVSGLTARFGERELTTEVNALRLEHLKNSNDKYYAESAFTISAGHEWGANVGGFDEVNARIGFGANAILDARTIRAYEKESDALLESPLSAIKASRGFVLPRNVEDIRSLRPGESFALRGNGSLGANLGVGVPILVASPGAFTYNLVLSAGLRARFDGDIDVQLVRMDGDDVVIDVGIQTSTLREGHISLKDGWGVAGLVQQKVSLGGMEVDLGKLAESALKKRVLDKLSLVSASIESTNKKSRLSVARFRFSLDQATPGSSVEKALAHTLRADLRLAQALSNRSEKGVIAEFELTRSGVSSASYAGVDILGMSFFRKVQESEGSVVVETPGGARTVLFESLHKEAGWFFSSHGYGRTGLSGLVFDPAAPTATEGEANLLLQIVEGDDFMERDKLLDHVDGIIRSVAGDVAFRAIEQKGNELQRYVVKKCPNSQAFDPCRTSVLSDPKVVALRAEGVAALDNQIGDLSNDARTLVLKAGELRMTAQATLEPAAQFVGPGTSVVVDYRLDDTALTTLMSKRTSQDLSTAARAHMVLAGLDRGADTGKVESTRASLDQKWKGTADQMGVVFDRHATFYKELLELEEMKLAKHPELGEMGTRAVEIRFPEKNGKPDYESAALRSLPQARANVATTMFDDLLKAASASGAPFPEQTVAYALLGLTEKKSLDLRLSVQMDIDDGFAQDFEHYRTAGYDAFKNLDLYARGSAVSPVDGGLFNIDALIKVDK